MVFFFFKESTLGNLHALKHQKKTHIFSLNQLCFFFFSTDKKPLWIWEVTSPASEVKTEQKPTSALFKEQGYHITKSRALYPKRKERKKQCLWAAVRCKIGVLERAVCECVRVFVSSTGKGQILPASVHSVSLGRIITLLTGFPFHTR